MEALKALVKDLSSSLENNKSFSSEEQKSICMQLFLYEGVMDEFQALSKERDNLRIENKKLEEEMRVLKKQIQNVQVNEELKSRDTIKNLELEILHLRKQQSEFELLSQAHSTLLEELYSTIKLVDCKNVQIQKLEDSVSKQQSIISELRKDLKVFGKKPVLDIPESLNFDKIQSAGRLSFLVPINEEQSVWLQFRKEKEWLQCSVCGVRGLARSRCSHSTCVKPELLIPKPKVYYQRDLKKRVKCINETNFLAGKDIHQPTRMVSDHSPCESSSASSGYKEASSGYKEVSSEYKEVEIKTTLFSSSFKDIRGEKISQFVASRSNEGNKLMLKRTRFRGHVKLQERKFLNSKIKLRGGSPKPIDVFNSLLFPCENKKRLKQTSPRSLAPVLYPFG